MNLMFLFFLFYLQAMQPRQEITFDIEDQPQIFADATPKIRSIRFGDWEMDTWYVAPYPEE